MNLRQHKIFFYDFNLISFNELKNAKFVQFRNLDWIKSHCNYNDYSITYKLNPIYNITGNITLYSNMIHNDNEFFKISFVDSTSIHITDDSFIYPLWYIEKVK